MCDVYSRNGNWLLCSVMYGLEFSAADIITLAIMRTLAVQHIHAFWVQIICFMVSRQRAVKIIDNCNNNFISCLNFDSKVKSHFKWDNQVMSMYKIHHLTIQEVVQVPVWYIHEYILTVIQYMHDYHETLLMSPEFCC